MRTSTCVHCGAELRLRSCGCWVDASLTRWCVARVDPADCLHDPVEGVQPERCQAPVWPPSVIPREDLQL